MCLVVQSPGIRPEPRVDTGGSRPQPQVQVFAIEKDLVVEASEPAQGVRPGDQARAYRPSHLAGGPGQLRRQGHCQTARQQRRRHQCPRQIGPARRVPGARSPAATRRAPAAAARAARPRFPREPPARPGTRRRAPGRGWRRSSPAGRPPRGPCSRHGRSPRSRPARSPSPRLASDGRPRRCGRASRSRPRRPSRRAGATHRAQQHVELALGLVGDHHHAGRIAAAAFGCRVASRSPHGAAQPCVGALHAQTRLGARPGASPQRPPPLLVAQHLHQCRGGAVRVAGRKEAPGLAESTISAGPPPAAATTGVPQASASAITRPKGSRSAQCSRQAALRSSDTGSSVSPTRSTRPARSCWLARALRRSASAGPSAPRAAPTMRSRTSGRRSRARASVSRARSGRFQSMIAPASGRCPTRSSGPGLKRARGPRRGAPP